MRKEEKKAKFTRLGLIRTVLVTSNSRVSPIAKQTIPRLELLGALILSRLMPVVKKALCYVYSIGSIFALTDSSVVYGNALLTKPDSDGQ